MLCRGGASGLLRGQSLEADLHVGVGEVGRLGQVDHVAQRDEAAAETDGRPVDGRDDGHAALWSASLTALSHSGRFKVMIRNGTSARTSSPPACPTCHTPNPRIRDAMMFFWISDVPPMTLCARL